VMVMLFKYLLSILLSMVNLSSHLDGIGHID
jgi:hypothetical protein